MEAYQSNSKLPSLLSFTIGEGQKELGTESDA